MRIALLYGAAEFSPAAARAAAGICTALRDGGIETEVLTPSPVSLQGCTSYAYDPALTAAFTAGWQRNWRLPLGLRAELERMQPAAVLCPGEPTDVLFGRLALGYSGDAPLVSWLTALGEDGALARYADLHLAPSAADAAALAALAPPPRPVVMLARPVPNGLPLAASKKTMRIVWVGRADLRSGLPVLLQALARLPEEWRLTVASEQSEDPNLSDLTRHLAVETRCEWLLPFPDPWERISEASLCVVTSDRPSETGAIAEAAARGIPVFATEGASGARDILLGEASLPPAAGALADALLGARGSLAALSRRQARRAQEQRRDLGSKLLAALRYLPPERREARST